MLQSSLNDIEIANSSFFQMKVFDDKSISDQKAVNWDLIFFYNLRNWFDFFLCIDIQGMFKEYKPLEKRQ